MKGLERVGLVAHRAFFLNEGERTRLVDLIRRVSRFSGVKLLAYSVMSNHFHVFVYIGYPEKLDDAEIVSRIAALYDATQIEAEVLLVASGILTFSRSSADAS